MAHKNLVEIISSLVLVVLAVLLLNPFHFWMPSMSHMWLLAGLLVAFGVFTAFILREQAEDEREAMHRMLAGRTAFLLGAGVLVLGIAWQGYKESIDPWLVSALLAMVIGKVLSRLRSDSRF